MVGVVADNRTKMRGMLIPDTAETSVSAPDWASIEMAPGELEFRIAYEI